MPAEMLRSLPAKLRAAQRLFETTGGLHAAGLFTATGDLVAVREDVGRHNAVDKLIGWAFMEDRLPLAGHVIVVSGRSSFELVQKSLVAGPPRCAPCLLRAASPLTSPASSGSPWWGSCARRGSRSTAARKELVWPNLAGPEPKVAPCILS